MSVFASPAEPAPLNSAQESTPVAKAKLLQLALNNASRARVSVSAHALLAHVVADSWPSDDGWACHTSQASFATRLATTIHTIRRLALELDAAGVALYRAGRGTRRSRFVVPAQALAPTLHGRREVPAPAQGLTLHGRRDIPIPIFSPAAPERHEAQEPAPMALGTPPAAAGALTPSQEALRATIVQKPSWLPENNAWIEGRTARELAALPTTCIDAIAAALSATRSRRKTLTNPAGFFLTRLRAPDPADVAAARATRERAEAFRAKRVGQRDAGAFFADERARRSNQ